MTIKQYAELIGITATEEQLEKLKQYMQHRPSVEDLYLLPFRVIGFNADLEVVAELPEGRRVAFPESCFTPDRLASNYPTPKPGGLQAKFQVGDKVRALSRIRKIESIGVYYIFENGCSKVSEEGLELVED